MGGIPVGDLQSGRVDCGGEQQEIEIEISTLQKLAIKRGNCEQTFWFSFITFLLPPPTSDASCFCPVAEYSFPLLGIPLCCSRLRGSLLSASSLTSIIVAFHILIYAVATRMIVRAQARLMTMLVVIMCTTRVFFRHSCFVCSQMVVCNLGCGGHRPLLIRDLR